MSRRASAPACAPAAASSTNSDDDNNNNNNKSKKKKALADFTCPELVCHEDTSLHGWLQVHRGGKSGGGLRRSTRRYAVLNASTLFLFKSDAADAKLKQTYNCIKKSIRQMKGSKSHPHGIQLQHLRGEDFANGGERFRERRGGGGNHHHGASTTVSNPASASPPLRLALETKEAAKAWMSKLYFASIGLVAAATQQQSGGRSALVSGALGPAAVAAQITPQQPSSSHAPSSFLFGPLTPSRRSTEAVQQRQMQHLQIATGILAKYDALRGATPSPEQYSMMLSELLHCVDIGGRSVEGEPISPSPVNTKKAGVTVEISRRNSAKDRSSTFHRRLSAPVQPHVEREVSRATSALRAVGLDGFRGLLRDMCEVHSFDDLLHVKLTDDVRSRLGMSAEQQIRFASLQEQLNQQVEQQHREVQRVQQPNSLREKSGNLIPDSNPVSQLDGEPTTSATWPGLSARNSSAAAQTHSMIKHRKLKRSDKYTTVGADGSDEEDDSSCDDDDVNITSLNDVFFPRFNVSAIIQPLRTFNNRSFARSLAEAALPQKIRTKLAEAFKKGGTARNGGGKANDRNHAEATWPPGPRGTERQMSTGGKGRPAGSSASDGNITEAMGLPNVKNVTSWLDNLCTVVKTFNKYLRAFGSAPAPSSSGGSEKKITGENATAGGAPDAPANGGGGDADDDGFGAEDSEQSQSFLHLAHLINILKGLLLAPPKLLVVQDSSRASDKYKAHMDSLQLYLCKLSPTAIQYHKLLTLFAYVQTYYNLEVDNDDIDKRLGTLHTIRVQARHVLARFKCYWIDDEGTGAATKDDIEPLVKDILQKASNITHLLHRTQKLEASFPTEALIDMVEGRSSVATVGVGAGASSEAVTSQRLSGRAMPARTLQGMYNLEACGFPLHIPKQFLAKHWAFWKEHFRDRLTFPRYMCFNRFLTKEHLRELILNDPERWEEFNSFSRALANGIPAFKMVKYLETEAERAPYRVTFKDGKCFNSKGNLLDTGDMMSGKVHFKPTRERNETGKGWAIAVLHRTHGLFVGSHSRDAFHHSSFLAAVEMGVHFAGELKVVAGNIVAVTNNSGHYKPGEVHIRNLLQWLREDDKVPQETVDAIEVTNVCEQLYYPQQHKAEFLEEIRDTMRQAMFALYVAEDGDDAISTSSNVARSGARILDSTTTGPTVSHQSNDALSAPQSSFTSGGSGEPSRESASKVVADAGAKNSSETAQSVALKSATFPGATAASRVRQQHQATSWKEIVSAAMRLQALILSPEKIAALRTFVGVKMSFRHLSSPQWAEWFAAELKTLVLRELRVLQSLSARAIQ